MLQSAVSSQLPAVGRGWQVAGRRWPAVGIQQPAVSRGQRFANRNLRSAACGLRIAVCGFGSQNTCFGAAICLQLSAASRRPRFAGRGSQVASGRHPATSSQPRSAICESRSADCGFRFPKYMLWGCNLPSALSRQPSAVVRDLRPAACGLRTARERLPYKHTKRDL